MVDLKSHEAADPLDEKPSTEPQSLSNITSVKSIILYAGVLAFFLLAFFLTGHCPRCWSQDTVPIKTCYSLGTANPLDTEDIVHLVPEFVHPNGNVFCNHCRQDFYGLPGTFLKNLSPFGAHKSAYQSPR